MQSLQTKKKIAISLGVIAAIVATSSTMLSAAFLADADSGIIPSNKMPVRDSDVPEMIVSGDTSVSNKMRAQQGSSMEMVVPDDASVFNTMPAHESDTPEMIVSDDLSWK
jgi:hypothetical protein